MQSPAPPIIPHLPGVSASPKARALFLPFFTFIFYIFWYISLALRHQSAMLQSSPSSSEINMADQGYSY